MKIIKGSLIALATVSLVAVANTTLAEPTKKGISNAEKAGEALLISNMMGRYSAYVIANKWDEIGAMFALDEPDVHQNVPAVMSGPAVRTYFTTRAAAKLPDGVLHQHSFLSPVIEVAGDDKTAKGVWDSPGIDTGDGNKMANWAWVRYAIDFKKINGDWKIWHLSVLPVWRAAYGEEWSKMVAKDSGGKMTGGGPVTGEAGAPPAGPMPPPPGAGGPKPPMPADVKWRYSGVGDTPMIPANLPKPYYTFDPADAY